MHSRLIRCRLSNEVSAAVEFTVRDGPSLAAACQRALDRYVREHGSPTAPLVLQVRPTRGTEALGWFLPIRQGRAVRVLVSQDLLDRRPPDDWTEIWTWVQTERAQAGALDRLADDTTEPDGGDARD